MMTLKILFDNRADGRRFLSLSKKHRLLKKYFVSWEKRVITFSFENEEQKEVLSNVIFGVLKELEVEYKVVG